MFDRLLAFASVTAVVCFGSAFTIGGCSSSAPAGSSPAVDAGNTPDGKVTRPPPTGEDPPEETCGPKGESSTMASLDTEFGWKPPAPRQNACTPADLEAIKAVEQVASYADFVAGTSAACKACALTTKDAPNWGPIVADGANPPGMANFGACFAAADNPACGKARQYLELCIAPVCSACTTPSDRQTCIQEAVQEQCAAVFTEAQTQCTVAEADAQCSSLVDGIEYLCAFEGADAGALDGGDGG